jgi:hypothetical protein
MNPATGNPATLNPFEEDACPVTLAKEEIPNPGPTLIYITVQECLPGNSQLTGNTLTFFQTQIYLVLSTAYATTKASYWGRYSPILFKYFMACHTAHSPN